MKNKIYAIILFLVSGCTEPIDLSVEGGEYLVVDGFISTASKQHIIRLSRSVDYSPGNFPKPVENADLTITDDSGNFFPLKPVGIGVYAPLPGFQAEVGKTYTLQITTEEGKEYLSTPQKITQKGMLDSVYFKIEQNIVLNDQNNPVSVTGIQYYLDHTLPDEEAYYMWRWDGTYLLPTADWNPDEGIPLECYVADNSSHFKILSSLTAVAHETKSTKYLFVKPGAEYRNLYSFNVTQYTINEEIYSFFNDIQEQQENTGSIFDPASTRIDGNIRNKNDPNETVLGYFGAFGAQEKRIFIYPEEVPEISGPPVCETIWPPAYCSDCRLWVNSSEEKPAFWPQ